MVEGGDFKVPGYWFAQRKHRIPRSNSRRVHRAALAGICLPLLLAACGQAVIQAAPTERVVSSFVYQHTGFRPTDVACPSGVKARVGGKFQCHFSGPDGKYTAYMSITGVHAQRVTYEIQTQRNGQTILADPAARSVSAFVFKRTGFQPKDVTCPSDVPAQAGQRFECQFTGPDGRYTADVVITSVTGRPVRFQIRTRRSH